MKFCTFSILSVLTVIKGASGWNVKKGSKILISDIDEVVGVAGKYTSTRRGAPTLQLSCKLGGSGGCRYPPHLVRCYNKGGSGLNVKWKCYAVMKPGYGFGQIHVSCEGFSYPGDPYVLSDSCAIRYTLNLDYDEDYVMMLVLFTFVVFIFLLILLCCCCSPPTGNAPNTDPPPPRDAASTSYYYNRRPHDNLVILPSSNHYHTTSRRSSNHYHTTSRRTNMRSGTATSSSR